MGKITQSTIDFVKQEEGFKNKAYKDIAKLWTTGVGHLIKADEQHLINETLTDEQVDSLLRKDLAITEAAINKYVKVQINQHQFDALASFIFNVGVRGFGTSSVLKHINAGASKETISKSFELWSKITINGKKETREALLNRRKREVELYFS